MTFLPRDVSSPPPAKISRRADRFSFSDPGGFLSSTNVNGGKIKEAHIFKNEDRLEIGNSAFVFTQASKEQAE